MLAVGICGTDQTLATGRRTPPQLPWRLGHEGIGEIAEVGPGACGFAVGTGARLGDFTDAFVAQPPRKLRRCAPATKASVKSPRWAPVPTANPQAPGPTSAISPMPSWPSRHGSCGGVRRPVARV